MAETLAEKAARVKMWKLVECDEEEPDGAIKPRIVYECLDCGVILETKEKLEIHDKSKHTVKKSKHQCEECHTEFSNAKAFRHHNLSLHEQLFNEMCHFCGKKFTSVTTVRSHIASDCSKRNLVQKIKNGEGKPIDFFKSFENANFEKGYCWDFLKSQQAKAQEAVEVGDLPKMTRKRRRKQDTKLIKENIIDTDSSESDNKSSNNDNVQAESLQRKQSPKKFEKDNDGICQLGNLSKRDVRRTADLLSNLNNITDIGSNRMKYAENYISNIIITPEAAVFLHKELSSEYKQRANIIKGITTQCSSSAICKHPYTKEHIQSLIANE